MRFSIHGTLILLIWAGVPIPVVPSESKSEGFADDELRQLYTEYLQKETSITGLTSVRFLNLNGEVIGPSDDLLKEIGKENLSGVERVYGSTLTLSLSRKENSSDYELCAVSDTGPVRWRTIWIYPLVSKRGDWEIIADYTGEIINFLVKKDGSVFYNGRDAGVGSVRAIVRMGTNYIGDEVRVLLIVQGNPPSEIISRIMDEVRIVAPEATIMQRRFELIGIQEYGTQ